MKKYILVFFFSIGLSFANAGVEEEISSREGKIDTLTIQIENQTGEYEEDLLLLERKFVIERQRELSDCSEREVSCISSQAEKKYQPLFDELKNEYLLNIEPLQESITELSNEIKQIQQDELDAQQRLLDERTNTDFIPGFGTDIFSEEDTLLIDELKLAITSAVSEKDGVISTYENDLAELERKFTIERQTELDDCEVRNISCASSFAKRKYEPLYEELEQQYFIDLFFWTEKIREFEDEIQNIILKKEEDAQESLLNRTDEEVAQDQLVLELIEQSELDYEKAEIYFENKSYSNAAIFYAKSCAVEYAKHFLCYNGLALSQEELYEFESSLENYNLALEASYTQEDAAEIEISISRVNNRIKLISKLNDSLETFIQNIDEKFEGRELILKTRFYDETLLAVTNKRKNITNENTVILFDIVILAFRDARRVVEQEINDLYN